MRYEADVDLRVSGIPCGAVITNYIAGVPMLITGSGFGDAEPPEPEEVEFFLIDRKGYPAKWLEKKVKKWIDLEHEVLAKMKKPR